MYIHSKRFHSKLTVLIEERKVIDSTVAPVNCKERDGSICFRYICCQSSIEGWRDSYGGSASFPDNEREPL